MRITTVVTVIALSAGASAQVENPYASIELAVAQTQAQPNIILDAGGWSQVGDTSTRFQLRLFTKEGKFYVEQFIDQVKRLVIVADGTKVWRYDPVINEYTFMNQPETFPQTLGVIAAWSRRELQRPMRSLAGSVRWMVRPEFETGRSHVRVFQTRPVGQDWRGTDSTFLFDDHNRLERIVIEDKNDTAAGLEHSSLQALFAFPANLPIEFTFKIPAGAKPAADLPKRISGDGGTAR